MTTSVVVALDDSEEEQFRVGPTVRLRPLSDQINASQDGLIEVYLKNPEVNDVTLHFDVDVSVPSGMHVYGEGFGAAAAAGTVSAQFDINPGTERTVYINIKAEQTGEFSIHFSGYYWPGDNKDDWRPVSLTYPITVNQPSSNPTDSSFTNPDQIPGDSENWWGNPLWIALFSCLGIVLIVTVIALLKRGKTEISIEE
ncbi:hypothetical protein ACFLW2_03265 [Chloroflexota bacterium]